MSPAEIEALVEQVGEEILGRLGVPASALNGAAIAPQAPASAWPRPAQGYASALEWVCGAPDATTMHVRTVCEQARAAKIPVVWVPVRLVAAAVAALGPGATSAGALVDYPDGASSTAARLADVETALRLGAGMVNLTLGAGRVREADADVLRAEIRAAAEICAGAPLAVTLEAELLSAEELERAAAAALAGGADALCCGTGRQGHAYASDQTVATLRKTAGGGAVVIAGGRIAGFGHAAALIAAGADRIAADDPVALLSAAPAA